MILRHIKPLSLVAVAATAFASCVDDNYDLSDIDTTVRVMVNDLTVPVNLDEIELKSILKEGDEIKIVDGRYVITEDGTFESAGINIGAVTVGSQSFSPTEVTMPFIPAALATTGDAGEFKIELEPQTFKFDATDIPAEITGVDALGGDLQFIFNFKLSGLSAIASRIELRDLVLQLPKGLHLSEAAGGSYDASTGLAVIPTQSITGEEFSLALKADRLDLNAMGAQFDYSTHALHVSGDYCVKSASLCVAKADLMPGAQPTFLKLVISYSIPDFPVTSFSGHVKYDITGVNISDVDLSDLPDVLTQSGTNISIVNPCIFISLTNPLGNYGLSARTGMTITAWHGNDSKDYSINDPYFTIVPGDAQGKSAYCLSPIEPTVAPEGYASAIHVPFTSLSNVLSGDGLPSRLGITLDNPNVNDQPVVNLPLGTNIGSVSGSYSFFAPIALSEGSQIVYSDKADGWGSDDLDKLTVTELHVRASITCDIPLALDAKAYPIDKDGNDINGVSIVGAKLNAGSDPQSVDIHITGAFRGLDGIRYEVIATAGDQNQQLTPDMHIRVSNLRPTVSGYFEKEL